MAERAEDTAGTPVLDPPQGEQNFEISENRYTQIAGTAARRQDVQSDTGSDRIIWKRKKNRINNIHRNWASCVTEKSRQL